MPIELEINEDLLRELAWQEKDGIWSHPITGGRFDLATAIEVTARAFEGYTGNEEPDWEPSDNDVRWQQKHVRMVGSGIWGTSEGTFKLYSDRRQALLIKGDPEKGLIRQIVMVFKKMGWTVFARKGTEEEPI